jgi:acetyltransferase-like isoleucine patch superfamily enzyme
MSKVRNIGNGVIISAVSVVAKDIPDYVIVAGIPTKLLSFRFKLDEIEWLSKLKWRD